MGLGVCEEMLLEWSSVFIGAVSELDQELMYHIRK